MTAAPELKKNEIISQLDGASVVRLLDTAPRTNFFESVKSSSESVIRLNERVVERGKKVRTLAEQVLDKPEKIKYVPYELGHRNEADLTGFIFVKKVGDTEIEVSISPEQIPKSIHEHVYQGNDMAVLGKGSSPGEVESSFVPTAKMIEDLHKARNAKKRKIDGKTRKKFDETTEVKISWDKTHTEYVRNYYASGYDVVSGKDIPLSQTRWTVVKESNPLGVSNSEMITVTSEPDKHPKVELHSKQGSSHAISGEIPQPLVTQELQYPDDYTKKLKWSKVKLAYRPSGSGMEQFEESYFYGASIYPITHAGWHVEAAGQYNPDEEKMVRRSAINSGQSTQPNRNPIDGAYIAQHPLLSECGIEKDGRTAPDIKVILYPTNSGLQRQ